MLFCAQLPVIVHMSQVLCLPLLTRGPGACLSMFSFFKHFILATEVARDIEGQIHTQQLSVEQ